MKKVLVLIVLCLTLTIIWFHKGLIFAGGEEGIPFYDLEKTVKFYTSVWHDAGTGFPAVNIGRIPLFSLLKVFYQFGIPGFALQAFLFFLLMSTGSISVYFLLKETVIKDINSNEQKIYGYLPLIGGIFYLLNPFSMSQIWGRGLYMQFFPFALFPLFLILIILGLKRRNFLYGILALISSVILSAAFDNISYAVSLWLLAGIYAIFHLNLHFKKKEIIFTAVFFIFLLLGWVWIHLFWILPFLKLSTQPFVDIVGNIDYGLGSLRSVSWQYPLPVLIRLMHSGYFYENLYGTIYSGFIFGVISWIIPLAAAFSIKKFKKLHHFKFFGPLFLVGLFISLGSNFPTGWFFELIFKYIPFFQMFRNPFEKFGLVFLIAYVPFFSLGVLIVSRKIGSLLKKEIFVFLSGAIIVVLVCGVYVWPMWAGIFAGGYRLDPWVKVPGDYKNLSKWLDENAEEYRIFMTPLWSGDGTFYQWGNTKFQGTDPMVYLINQPAVSYSSQLPWMLLGMRKYMERINMSSTLALFQAKYLIDRGDVLKITETEKQHKNFLTGTLYPPIGTDLSKQKVCQDKYSNSRTNGVAWITCQISNTDSDWSRIRYAHFAVKTDVPSYLEFALSDKNGTRIRWYGPSDAEYQTDDINETVITIPLSAPTEYNLAIDFSKVNLIEVLAHPKDSPKTSSGEISLKEIALDPGEEEKLNNFRQVQTFGNLQVYEPVRFNPPPEFGSLSSVDEIKDIVTLYKEADNQKDTINTKGFVLTNQNKGKNLQNLSGINFVQIINKHKISGSKYWVEMGRDNEYGLLILSKLFNLQWKVIPGVGKDQLTGGFFDNINLLKKATLSEDSHFMVNGYANLWKVQSSGNQYAIVFMPQIFADIGSEVSKIGIVILLGVALIWGTAKFFRKE